MSSSTPSFRDMAKGGLRGFRATSQKKYLQDANLVRVNANLQAALITNSSREVVPDSRVSNPAKASVNEKWDIADQQRNQLKDHLQSVSDRFKGLVLPLIPLYATLGSVVTPTLQKLPAKMADLGALLIKIGMVKAHGWKLDRLTDGWLVFAKFFTLKTETAISMVTPSLVVSGGVVDISGDLVSTQADLKIDICMDSIQRISNVYGLDANYLTAVIQAAALIHAGTKVEIATTGTMELSALAGMSTITTATAKHTAGTHTFVDLAGGSIEMTGGIINLNPLLPAGTPDTPIVCVPMPPIVPTELPAKINVIPQYEGMSAHGTSNI